jgi:hypothetical protein
MDPAIPASIRDSIDLQRSIYAQEKGRRGSNRTAKDWLLGQWYSVLQRY